MSYFLVTPQDRAALTAAYARSTGAPDTAADLLGQAAHDEAEGLPRSAATLRHLADERLARA